MQLLATCRTDVTCSVGMFELMPLSRVAAAPAPVAPVAPVGPVVAGEEVAAFEKHSANLDLAVHVFAEVGLVAALQPVRGHRAGSWGWRAGRGIPAVPAAPVGLEAGPDVASVRMKPEPEPDVPAALDAPVAPPLVVAPPALELLELSPDFRHPVIVTWLPDD